MKFVKFAFVLGVVFCTTLAFAQEPAQKSKAQKATKQEATLAEDGTDPVCKMKVSKGSKIISVHNGKQVGFCSKMCKDQYDKHPEKFNK